MLQVVAEDLAIVYPPALLRRLRPKVA